MVLKGKFTTYNEFFDLIKLITQMQMTISLSLLNEKIGKEMFIAFDNGKLVDIESSSEDLVLLNFNFSQGKVTDLDYVKGVIFSFLVDFENVKFETVSREKKKKFNIEGFEAIFLDVVRELDEIDNFPENKKMSVNCRKLSSPEKNEVVLSAYLLSGYTLYQAIFSFGKVKEYIKVLNTLVKKGAIN